MSVGYFGASEDNTARSELIIRNCGKFGNIILGSYSLNSLLKKLVSKQLYHLATIRKTKIGVPFPGSALGGAGPNCSLTVVCHCMYLNSRT